MRGVGKIIQSYAGACGHIGWSANHVLRATQLTKVGGACSNVHALFGRYAVTLAPEKRVGHCLALHYSATEHTGANKVAAVVVSTHP